MTEPKVHPRRARDDAGVSLLIVAISLVALVLVAALAVDGGQAYANRRQMQNGSDAGAMAGTRAVSKLRFEGVTDGGTIYDAVDAARSNNGGSSVSCWLISSTKARLSGDVCTSRSAMVTAWNSLKAVNPPVAGVEVKQTGSKKSIFAGVAGMDSLSASAFAAATLQPFVAAAGGAPFIVCGVQDPADLISFPFDILDAANQVKPSAIGKWYGLQGVNSEVGDCGAGSSAFDGTGDDEPPVIGEWIDAGNGNGFSQETLSEVLSSDPCTPDLASADGCLMVLPLVTAGRGNGVNIEMYVVAFGVFEVYGDGRGNVRECREALGNPSPKYCGILRGQGQISAGTGGTGEVLPNNPYVIKLVK